jgi:diacylglycerol O-acyltransferase
MSRTEWVDGRDGAFFLLESPTTPYHAAGLMTTDGPPIAQAELLASVERKLPLLPRFRQRLEYPALVDRAVWIDDPHFDLEYHVRRTSLPEPGTREQLGHAVAELMEEHLSRFRPLWELWAIDGLREGGTALLLKVHHSVADGVTGAHDMMLLFDDRPGTRRRGGRHGPEPWEPEPSPSPGRLLADATVRMAARPAAGAGALARMARDPSRLVGGLLGFAEIAAAALRPAPRCPMNAPIGPNRSFASVTTSLRDVKDVKDALGGTVNDVVVAATAGGLRHWLLSRDEPVAGVELRALIPVSLRRPGDGDASGNLVTGVLAPLPVYEADPVERLRTVSMAMTRAKHSRQALGAWVLLNLPAFVPTIMARRVAAVQRVQRFFNLSLTNVPGPEAPLYIAGRRVVDMIPVPPLSANTGLIVGALSYAGRMSFGLVADPDTVDDIGIVAEGIERSLFELIEAAAALAAPGKVTVGGAS